MSVTPVLTRSEFHRIVPPASNATPWQLAGEAAFSLRGGLRRIGRWFRDALPEIAEGIADGVGDWLESLVTWEPKDYRELHAHYRTT